MSEINVVSRIELGKVPTEADIVKSGILRVKVVRTWSTNWEGFVVVDEKTVLCRLNILFLSLGFNQLKPECERRIS